MKLTSEQVAAAEFAAIQFLPATPDQVHRLTMQRKVFWIGEAAMLATRDGSLFETAATLAVLIDQGERQRRDLAGWQRADAPPTSPARDPEPATTHRLETMRAEFVQRVKAEGQQLGIGFDALPLEVARSVERQGEEAPAKRKVTPKYRGPNGEEWAGRGRTPKWVLIVEADGKSRDDFLIGKAAERLGDAARAASVEALHRPAADLEDHGAGLRRGRTAEPES